MYRHLNVPGNGRSGAPNGVLSHPPSRLGKAQRSGFDEEEEKQGSKRELLAIAGSGVTRTLLRRRRAPLAQLVEHLTLNQGVQGSSP